MWKYAIDLVKWIVKRMQYKSRLESKLDAVLAKQTELGRKVCRLEILEAMRRDDRAVVHQLYDIYRNDYAGNSYMAELYKDYCKKPTRKRK